MGAPRRLSVRAILLAAMTSALVGSALPACQFPDYAVMQTASGGGGSSGGDTAPMAGNSTSGAGAASTGGSSGGVPLGGAGTGGVAGMAGGGGSTLVGGDGGDAGESGAAGDGGGGAGPDGCATSACVAAVPAGWLGPVVYSEVKAGNALAACPDGYGDPLDLHRGVNAPAPNCKCTCAPQGQSCGPNADVTLYLDQSCSNVCAEASSLSSCQAITGCTGSQGSMRAEVPTPSGGSCKPTVTGQPPTAAWQNDARICQATKELSCPSDQLCAPTPPLPYLSTLCVMRVIPEGQAQPSCPTEYPTSLNPFYSDFKDTRGCSACTCSGVNGGSCAGSLTMTDAGTCSNDVTYTLGEGCKTFNLGTGNVHPSHVGATFTLTPGTCSVATPPTATGNAVGSGNSTVLCCR